jgi:hypothetical protein
MKKLFTLVPALLPVLLLLGSPPGHAHKRWLLPTDFSLSDAETVTVDFTASNNIFYVDKPMPLDGVRALSPAGDALPIDNPRDGARRSSFDLEIAREGTHRVVVQGAPVYFLSYKLPDEEQPRYERGPLEVLKNKVPEGAQEVRYARSSALIETYITLGAPSQPAAIGSADGITLQPVSHPNELYSDEPGEFILQLDGRPAAGLALVVMPEGTRYRDTQAQARFVSDERGRVVVEWQGPGRYLLEAAFEAPGEGGEIAAHYYNYFLTVEVLAP